MEFLAMDRVIIAMRHSVRADMSGNFEMWDEDDRRSRPYDSPISNQELPQIHAQLIKQYNINTIVSSPFRRCIETSAILCKELSIPCLQIDFGLAENMTYIRDTFPGTTVLEFLTREEMQAIVGENITIVSFSGECSLDESNEETAGRYQSTYHRILQDNPGESVLCITHWDGVMRLATDVMNHTPAVRYAHVGECGFLVLRVADRRPVSSHMINLVF